ncbi:MAG: SWIM zinc finger family protein [Bacteroidota bacterium]
MNSRFLSFIHENATKPVILRGTKLFEASDTIQLEKFTEDEAWLQVKGNLRDWYQVIIFLNPRRVKITTCNCRYDDSGICKHRVAALYFLDEIEREQQLTEEEEADEDGLIYNQGHAETNFVSLSRSYISNRSDQKTLQAINYLHKKGNFTFKPKDNGIAAQLFYKNEEFYLYFEKEGNTLISQCSCEEVSRFPFCIHKAGALLQLLEQDGEHPFTRAKDYYEQRNRLLKPYGYTINDPEVNELFKFAFKNGKLTLTRRDDSITRVDLSDIPNFQAQKNEHASFYSQTYDAKFCRPEFDPRLCHGVCQRRGCPDPHHVYSPDRKTKKGRNAL